MPDTWEAALQAYRYPVNLTTFEGESDYPGWFEGNLVKGDLAETIAFENRFRENAEHIIEAWYEVVFWKMYSQGGRADIRTQEMVRKMKSEKTTADELWNLCMEYIDRQNKESFELFRKKLHKETSPMVTTAAVFPAFLCPDRFPVVDSQITRWAKCYGPLHRSAPDISIAQTWKNDDVRINMWDFVTTWIEWCRYTRDRLNESSDRKREWRARDVEMAVFTRNSPYQAAWTQATHHHRREPW